MIAAIFAAAISSIAAELNSLATATVIEIYRDCCDGRGAGLALPDVSEAGKPASGASLRAVVATRSRPAWGRSSRS